MPPAPGVRDNDLPGASASEDQPSIPGGFHAGWYWCQLRLMVRLDDGDDGHWCGGGGGAVAVVVVAPWSPRLCRWWFWLLLVMMESVGVVVVTSVAALVLPVTVRWQ